MSGLLSVRTGFDVHNPLFVSVGQRIGYLAQDAHGLADRKLTFLGQLFTQQFTGNVRHHLEQEAF
jgi:hypothetical protein